MPKTYEVEVAVHVEPAKRQVTLMIVLVLLCLGLGLTAEIGRSYVSSRQQQIAAATQVANDQATAIANAVSTLMEQSIWETQQASAAATRQSVKATRSLVLFGNVEISNQHTGLGSPISYIMFTIINRSSKNVQLTPSSRYCNPSTPAGGDYNIVVLGGDRKLGPNEGGELVCELPYDNGSNKFVPERFYVKVESADDCWYVYPYTGQAKECD